MCGHSILAVGKTAVPMFDFRNGVFDLDRLNTSPGLSTLELTVMKSLQIQLSLRVLLLTVFVFWRILFLSVLKLLGCKEVLRRSWTPHHFLQPSSIGFELLHDLFEKKRIIVAVKSSLWSTCGKIPRVHNDCRLTVSRFWKENVKVILNKLRGVLNNRLERCVSSDLSRC